MKFLFTIVLKKFQIFTYVIYIIYWCGFRNGYSMVENIFALHSFFELIKLKKKKLFAAFVDFEKTFDTVWRTCVSAELQRGPVHHNGA
jgi:hypothetical protein